MAKKISNIVTWVGKTDWELKHFHGDELSTMHGSSYNAYLVQDTKTVLIDTVWKPFDKEFVSRLKEIIDLKQIDFIVMNHNEVDHSGALPELLREIPGARLLHQERRSHSTRPLSRRLEFHQCKDGRHFVDRKTYAEIYRSANVALARYDGHLS